MNSAVRAPLGTSVFDQLAPSVFGKMRFSPQDLVFRDCHGLHFISEGSALGPGHPHPLSRSQWKWA